MGLNGAEIVYALKKATTWGTAVACGATDGFLGLPASLDASNELIVDDSLGQFFVTDATPGKTKIDPAVNAYLRYNDDVVLSMLAAIMGTAGVPVTHAAGTLSKDHVLKVAKNTDGVFFTLAAKLGTGFVEEIPSFKLSKAVITCETGKPVQLAFSGPGIDLVTDSIVNTLATFAAVTILETANRAYMGQMVARINDQSAAALTVGDKIGPSKIVITLERKLTGVYGAFVDEGGRDLIDEPTNDGLWSSTVSITLPRLKDNTGQLKIKGNTSRKLDVALTGPIIEGAIPYSVLFQFPNLKPKNNSNPHKQGIIDNTWEFEALGAVAAPAGMTGITDPCWITLTNKITTNLLA